MPTSVVLMDGPTGAAARPILVTNDPEIVAEVKEILYRRIGLPGPRPPRAPDSGIPPKVLREGG